VAGVEVLDTEAVVLFRRQVVVVLQVEAVLGVPGQGAAQLVARALFLLGKRAAFH
jgi:hypothetical protein